jgi:hypothetical protein
VCKGILVCHDGRVTQGTFYVACTSSIFDLARP